MRIVFKLSVLLIVCSISKVHGQATAKIFGHVNTTAGAVAFRASIILHHITDSSTAKTSISDVQGRFEIDDVQSDNYFITVSYTGYAQKSTEIFSVNAGQNVILPVITLTVSEKKLSNVSVIGNYKKPMLEVTADKTIFNIESSINATGSNAFELLQKSPGVVTDKDDNIIVKGKNGVRIYIDGRQTQMESADLAAYLKSINSFDIEAIEIITNPSAKYDASGNAGIINIRFKKNKKIGFNGTVSAGLNRGVNPKTNTAASFNYRNKRLNFFSTYSNNWAINRVLFDVYRIQNDSLYDQKNVSVTEGWVHNFKTGLDLFLTKTQTLGVIVTGNTNDNFADNNTRTPISAVNDSKISQLLLASNHLPLTVRNFNYNLNYRYEDSTGHSFNFDADYGSFKSLRRSYQPNNYYLPEPFTLQDEKIYRNNTPNKVRISTAKFDYEKPFGKGRFGVGAKVSNVHTDNSFNFYNVLNGYDFLDSARSNIFSYKENITAGYINYNTPVNKKWNIQAGLRIEHTVSTGTLTREDGIIQADGKVERNYTDLFPSVAITYNLNDKHSFNLSSSRRIDRPIYQDLNPFENKLDELTYQKGNAFLRPQYTNSVQLSHTFLGRFITAISYSHVNDYSAQVIDTLEKRRTFLSKKNLASQDITNINFTLPFQVKKWWNLFANINLFQSHYKANFGLGKILDINIFSGSFYAQNSFTIGDGFTGEVSGFYNAPAVWAGTFRSRSMGGMDLGVQKQLYNNKATIKLSFTDALHTLRWKGTSDFGGALITTSGRWESQQVRINFTYRFGNSQLKQARNRKTGSEEEKKRTESEDNPGSD